MTTVSTSFTSLPPEPPVHWFPAASTIAPPFSQVQFRRGGSSSRGGSQAVGGRVPGENRTVVGPPAPVGSALLDLVNSYTIDATEAYLEWRAANRTEPIEARVAGDYSEPAGPNLPDAIYALLYRLGVGAIAAAAGLGLHVPEDVLFAACTDSTAAASCSPPLTSLDLNPGQIGSGAVESFLKCWRAAADRRTTVAYQPD